MLRSAIYRPRPFPAVVLGHWRTARGNAFRATVPAGCEVVRLRDGAVAIVADDLDRFERAEQVHLGTALAVSRRTRVRHALSGVTAALAHGLRVWKLPGRPVLTSPQKVSSARTTDYRRQTRALPLEDVVRIDGVPCTSLERTAVDCARDLDPLDALVVVDHVLALLSHADTYQRVRTEREAADVRRRLLARIDALPRGARGARRARVVVEWASPWAQSAPETFLRWSLLVWGRRDAVAQCRVEAEGNTYFTDLALPDGRRPDGTQRWLHIEYDGELKYHVADAGQTAAGLIAERNRERAILALGDDMARFDRRGARSPAQVARVVAAKVRHTSGQRLHPVRELLAN
ncbi:hypothetical protein [Georgenia sp. Z1491]|uniref:hypothetical protein n=1 Tax=Georgenia sp. Z1491 TaxID=3416707 RepID=UPI003CE7D18C